MYVFRVQQPATAPRQKAASSSRRSALRVSKRAAPSRQRVQLVARRALRLKDVPAASPRAGLLETPPAPVPGEKKREQVLDRLRLRLVERRAAEMIEALQRRHGERWSDHVREGSFHVVEAMRRICEAFHLRPELERQVLGLAMRRAQGWAGEAPPGSPLSLASSDCDCTSPLRSRASSLEKLSLLRLPPCAEGPGSSKSTASTSTSASFGSLTSSDGEATPRAPASKEAPELLWQECDWMIDGSQRQGPDAAPRARAPWGQRALRILDLERPADTQRCAAQQLEEGEDSEVDRSLVEAILNAERYTEVSEALKEVLGCEDESDCETHSRRRRSIDFRESDIRFFAISPDGEVEGEQYCRPLQTKVFDGPSGHKARKANCLVEAFGYSDDESDEEDEDWKDQCDDVAALMGQQRQMVLWSGSW